MGDSHARRSLEQSALMNEPGPSVSTMPPHVSYDWLQRRIVFAAVTFALALLAVQAFQAWNGYRTARTEAERRANNLVYILSAHMQEAVAALDACADRSSQHPTGRSVRRHRRLERRADGRDRRHA